MEYTEELMKDILHNEFVSPDYKDEMWVIMLGDKIMAPRQGRVFHDTFKDAQKHFYNEFRWRAVWKYKRMYEEANPSAPKYQYDMSERQMWEAFKQKMVEKGFEIIQWKYVKGDVCGKREA